MQGIEAPEHASVELSKVLTIAEAAKIMAIRTPTLRRWMAQRDIPYCRLGRGSRGRLVILPSDLHAFIAARRIPAIEK